MLADAPLWSGPQLEGNWDVIWYYSAQHARYTVYALALGFAVALPAAWWATRRRRAYPVMLTMTNMIYAIPSLALFAILAPALGRTNDKPVVVAMAMYTLVILVRNIVEGVRSAPPSAVQAADAMGYRSLRKFATVELPLALPSIIAGLRVAAVSTVSLISVGAVLGRGALGRVLRDGYQRDIPVELWAGTLAIVGLAIVVDALIYFAGKAATPWARTRTRANAALGAATLLTAAGEAPAVASAVGGRDE